MKRVRLFAIAAVIVLAVVAFAHYYNPFAPADLNALLSRELSKMSEGEFDSVGMTSMSRAQVDNRWKRYWESTKDNMLSKGAPEAEVCGVLSTARDHFSGIGLDGGFLYGVPVEAKLVWLRFRPIWIIKFGWGFGCEDPKMGMTEPPNHIRVLAISARKPYKLLGMQTCQ